MPSIRYGRGHIYNNYYNCTGNNYCIRARADAECLIQNNYFNQVDDPYYIYVYETPLARIEASGNILVNCTGKQDDGNDDVFDPPYSYTLDSNSDVPTIVMAGAGASGAPAAPTGLTATTGDGTASLDWNNNTEGDLAGYYVYRSTSSSGVYSRLNSSLLASSDYNDNTVTNGIIYYYVVTAVDTFSNESDYSNKAFSGLYGDFTGNGIVEMNDLPDFLDFWLVDDCDEPYWLDLDGDCIVNFYEFSVLAENWLQEP
jgi:hypothetical protein